MHKLAEKIADCMKVKVEAKGIDNIEGQDLVELGMWTDIIKDLVCYDKDKKIIEAMDEAEDSEEAMKYIEMYEDYPRKGYRGQPRDSKGRYMSRRGYESRMMPEMDYEEMERMRDLDRETKNKMYYTDSSSRNNTGGMNNSSSQSNGMEGRSGMARRGYIESKETNKDNSPESKQAKMKELENYMKSMAEDLTEAIQDATPEERTMAKQKLSSLIQKM